MSAIARVCLLFDVLLVAFCPDGLVAALRPAADELEIYLEPQSRDELSGLGESAKKETPMLSIVPPLGEVEPLATIHADANSVNIRGRDFALESAIPVFKQPGQDGYLALLQRWGFPPEYRDDRWDLLKPVEGDITCVSGTGSDKAERQVQIHGGESHRPSKTYFVIRCPLPASSFGERCHEVTLQDRGRVLGKVRGCQVDGDTKLAQIDAPKVRSTMSAGKKYGLAACVKPVYHSDQNPGRSGVLKLPQWLEYNVMHGVEHFVVYTFSKSFPDERALTLELLAPYLLEGMVSMVDLDQDYNHSDAQNMAHDKVINDCLYRMMHRTEWLLPSIDVDEYITWDGMREEASLLDATQKHATDDTFSLTMQRYDFQTPADPFGQLDIATAQRETEISNLDPKFLVRPEKVHNMFIHWVVTPVDDTVDNNLSLKPVELIANHYKMKPPDFHNITVDHTLVRQADTLASRLRARYGFPVENLFQRIRVRVHG